MSLAPMFRRPIFLVAAAVLVWGISPASAQEMRTWTSVDGKTVQAAFVSFDGTTVVLRGAGGQSYAFNKEKLSQRDLLYLLENPTAAPAPAPAPATTTTTTTTTKSTSPSKSGKVPNPAKDAKIDRKTFVAAGTFEIPQAKFDVLETPHFKIMHSPKAKPEEIAELAERLWLDTHYFHPTLAKKFEQHKKAVFLVDEESTYLAIGEWFSELLNQAGQADAAASVAKTWPLSASGTVHLPPEIAGKNAVLPSARVFRTYKSSGDPDDKDVEKIRGVWVPFRVHCLAKDLFGEVTGPVSSKGSGGYHGLSTGHAYFKEVSLTDTSETSLLSTESVEDVKSTGGFAGAGAWPEELKKQIRGKEVSPTLAALVDLTPQNATPATNVLAYSFLHFLHSNPERVAGWTKLVESISTSSQVPEIEEMAKLLGFESAPAMEKAWLDYLSSPAFK